MNEKFPVEAAKRLIAIALEEDKATDDITTGALLPAAARVKARILAQEQGLLAGGPVVGLTFTALARDVTVQVCPEGSLLSPGEEVAKITGPAAAILGGERVALNFLGRLSGVATMTARFVRLASRYQVEVFDTRKTTPGWRELEKYAVRVGGGKNHRFSLAEAVMLKDNHHILLQKKTNLSVEEVVRQLKKKLAPSLQVIVEVETTEQALTWAKAGVDVLMLDNLGPARIKEVLRELHKLPEKTRPRIEVSGGITLGNLEEICRLRPDRVSVGALTHSASWLSFSLEVID
jgi:nicotinate-nucleotide pyrophosphorylase (carboxylating)